MKSETKTEFVNRVMGLSFKSIQGKYSFCDDINKKILFSLDVGSKDDNDIILSPSWSKKGYSHSIKHIEKIQNEGYCLFVFKVKTQTKNGKTVPFGFDRVLEERQLIVDFDEGICRAIPIGFNSIGDDIQCIRNGTDLTETEKDRLVRARLGQGSFRQAVEKIEPRCRVTRLDDMQHLRASHIKPWRSASNTERLDGNNGLLLAPNIDHLFDRGYITFGDDGQIYLSHRLSKKAAKALGVDTVTSVGSLSPQQAIYMAYHREHVFLKLG